MSQVLYSSNMLKGGAPLESATLLARSWEDAQSVEENLDRVSHLGAMSATRRTDLRKRIWRPRFIDPGPHIVPALRTLLDTDPRAFRDACYFETTRVEPLLSDFAETALFEWYRSGRSEITPDDVRGWLTAQMEGGAAPTWSDSVVLRLGQSILANLRDFGVLEGRRGSTSKVIGHPYPTTAGFAYVCWRLQEIGVTAARVATSRVWRRWLLHPEDVNGLLLDLAQHGVILLNRAGSVTRMEWQAATLDEAVHGAA